MLSLLLTAGGMFGSSFGAPAAAAAPAFGTQTGAAAPAGSGMSAPAFGSAPTAFGAATSTAPTSTLGAALVVLAEWRQQVNPVYLQHLLLAQHLQHLVDSGNCPPLAMRPQVDLVALVQQQHQHQYLVALAQANQQHLTVAPLDQVISTRNVSCKINYTEY